MAVGDLGSGQDKGGGTVREPVCNDVRSDEARESGSQSSASEDIFKRGLTAMTSQQVELDTNEFLCLPRWSRPPGSGRGALAQNEPRAHLSEPRLRKVMVLR